MLLSLLVISTGITLSKMDRIGKEIKEIAQEDIPLIKIVTEITINQLAQAIHFERALRFALEKVENKNALKSFNIEKKVYFHEHYFSFLDLQ